MRIDRRLLIGFAVSASLLLTMTQSSQAQDEAIDVVAPPEEFPLPEWKPEPSGPLDRLKLTVDEHSFVDFASGLELGLTDTEILGFYNNTPARIKDTELAFGGFRLLDDRKTLGEQLTPLQWVEVLEAVAPYTTPSYGATADYLANKYPARRDDVHEWLDRSTQLVRLGAALDYALPDEDLEYKLDHATATMVVAVATEESRDYVEKQLAGQSDISLRVVEHSTAEILRALDEAAQAIVDIGVDPNRWTMNEDFDANGIVVTFDESLREESEIFHEKFVRTAAVGVSVQLGTVDAQLDANDCEAPATCGPTLRGGVGLARTSGAAGVWCTTGFTFSNGTNTRNSTAGHCDYNSAERSWHDGIQVGNDVVWTSVASNNIDVELHNIIDIARWDPRGTVYADWNHNLQVTGMVTQSSAAYNTVLCYSGWKSVVLVGLATRCGELDAKYSSLAGNNSNLGRLDDGCAGDGGGNSGGPVFSSGGGAYGLHKGSLNEASVLCYFSFASDVTALTGYSPVVTSHNFQSDVHAVRPVRIADSRTGFGGHGYWASQTASYLTVPVSSSVPDWATGVVAVVTVTQPAANGFLQAFPYNTALPNAGRTTSISNANFSAGQTHASTMFIPFGPNRRIGFWPNTGTHIVVDVNGYLSPGSTTIGYNSVTPSRPHNHNYTAGQGRWLQITGVAGVPTGASSVVANITVVSPTAPGWVRAGDTSGDTGTSLINFVAGETVPNLSVLKLTSSGKIHIRSLDSGSQILVDVLGYFQAGAYESYYHAPGRRAYSSYVGSGLRNITVSSTGVAVPASANNVLVNLTSTSATAPTWYTVYRYPASLPPTSNLNPIPGPVTGNHAVVETGYSSGSARIRHWSQFGSSRRYVDVVGYFDS